MNVYHACVAIVEFVKRGGSKARNVGWRRVKVSHLGSSAFPSWLEMGRRDGTIAVEQTEDICLRYCLPSDAFFVIELSLYYCSSSLNRERSC